MSKEEPVTIDMHDLQSWMRYPRYWKRKDPEFVKKVDEGFAALYGTYSHK